MRRSPAFSAAPRAPRGLRSRLLDAFPAAVRFAETAASRRRTASVRVVRFASCTFAFDRRAVVARGG